MSRRGQVFLWLAIVAMAVGIIIFTGRTPSKIRYRAELKRAADAVGKRQDAMLERFKIRTYKRYDVSQEQGLIVFSTDGTPYVVADVQLVGSYSDTSKTWLWAWANDSIPAGLVADSKRVHAFGEARRLERLTKDKWPATEEDGWEMANFQAHITGADLTYRTRFPQGWSYLTLRNMRLAAPGERYSFVPSK